MLEAAGGAMLDVVSGAMLEVVSGAVTEFCRELTCAVSKESWRVILFKSACWAAEPCMSDISTSECCSCDV